MDVDVWHRLTGGLANIDTDVVSIRFIFFIEDNFHFIDQRPDSRFFFGSRLKVISNMPARDDQAMTSVNRVAVVMSKSQLVFDDNLRFAAKGAVLVL